MDISVVIPTRDRRPLLQRTLAAVADQALEDTTAEVVVVDNGSTDGTPDAVAGIAESFPLPLRLIEEPHEGASAARNAGVAAASGDVVLFLGDDTRPADRRLLAGHVARHRGAPRDTYAVLGRVEWAPNIEVTPLMRWLDTGPQFAYTVMRVGAVGPEHFYTAHVSLKRSIIEEAGGFNPALPFLFEDNELGARLADRGLTLEYRPELVVHHDHAITLDAWVQRQRTAGRSGRLVNTTHPRHPALAPVPDGPRWKIARALAPLALGVPGDWSWMPSPLRERVYSAIHYGVYARAYADGA